MEIKEKIETAVEKFIADGGRVCRRSYGVNPSSWDVQENPVWKMEEGGCCALGALLAGTPWKGGGMKSEAAQMLGVQESWVVSFVLGFDGYPRGEMDDPIAHSLGLEMTKYLAT